ncbi:MAG: hypothetical protein JRF69_10395 [Deltaproteobacteria bacterium]|nr:hypothetical protein [Deltaproteobacteria bacterium]
MSGRGFVLVELLVAIGAALLVLGIIFGTFVYFERQSYDRESQVAQMQENLRAGMQKMARELPMAGRDPTRTAAAGLVMADSDTIRFTMDLNGDGDVSDAEEDVTYALDTKQLQLTRNGQPVAVDIPRGGLEFKYSDRNGHRLGATPLDGVTRKRVSRINIRLKARTAEPDPEYALDKGYRTKTVSHDMLMHNLVLANVPTTSTTELPTATKAKTIEATTKPLKTTEATTSKAKPKPLITTKATKSRAKITIVTTTPSTAIEATTPKATPEETTTSEDVDTEGPLISETSQIPFDSPVPNGVTVSICAAVTDPSGVESVTLLSDKHGSVAMSVYDGETYCSDLAKMNDTAVTYYIIAHDSLGHESTRGPYSYLQGK